MIEFYNNYTLTTFNVCLELYMGQSIQEWT